MQRELQSWHFDAVRPRVASGRGSPFYSLNAAGPSMGCIDTPVNLKISKHTFVGDKGGYYEITDDAPQSPGF
jgi:hypothetical protein